MLESVLLEMSPADGGAAIMQSCSCSPALHAFVHVEKQSRQVVLRLLQLVPLVNVHSVFDLLGSAS